LTISWSSHSKVSERGFAGARVGVVAALVMDVQGGCAGRMVGMLHILAKWRPDRAKPCAREWPERRRKSRVPLK
jgi:hypothetical protein